MANWNLPTIQSNYLDFVSEMNAKFTDAVTLGGTPTNLPVFAFRFNRSINIFEEWDGATWNPKVLGIAGGGTGTNNPAGIRVNLGLGSMSTQNSNAVNITGGTITGVAFNANDLTTGIISLARGGTGSSLSIPPFGWVMISNGANIGFDSGLNIAQLNANNLTAGTIPASRLTGVALTTAVVNTYAAGGRNLYNGDLVALKEGSRFSFGAYATLPVMNLEATSNAGGQRIIRVININGDFKFQRVDDNYTVAVDLFNITSAGQLQGYANGLVDLNGAAISFGQINTARMGVGTADSSTFLRGDGTWAVPTGSGGGGGEAIPSGLIAMFATNCPAGWTRVTALDNRFPLGGTAFGQQGGETRHSHSFSVNTTGEGAHSHSYSSSVSGRAKGVIGGTTDVEDNGNMNCDSGNSGIMARATHRHAFLANADLGLESATTSGETAAVGNHTHQVFGDVSEYNNYPPFTYVVFCQRN